MQGKRVDTQRERRGHEFLPEADTLGKIPVLSGTEDIPAPDKIIVPDRVDQVGSEVTLTC